MSDHDLDDLYDLDDLDDLDDLLAELRSDVPEMTDEAFEAGRARLPGGSRAAVVTRLPTEAPEAPTQGRPLRSPPRRWAQLAATAAGVVAIAAVAMFTQSAPTEPITVGSPQQLAEWARTLADNEPVVGTGQYLYVRQESANTADINGNPNLRTRTELNDEMWVPANWRDDWKLEGSAKPTVTWIVGSEADLVDIGLPPSAGATLGSMAEPPMVRPCGDFYWDKMHSVTPVNQCDGNGWMQAGSPEFFASLSGDPAKLYATLRQMAEGRGVTPELETLVQASKIVQPNSPPAFRATLFEAISKVPSLTVSSDATSITLSVVGAGDSIEWVLDRATGDLLGLSSTNGSSQQEHSFAYATVDEMGQRPTR